jgi:hypothetical protein
MEYAKEIQTVDKSIKTIYNVILFIENTRPVLDTKNSNITWTMLPIGQTVSCKSPPHLCMHWLGVNRCILYFKKDYLASLHHQMTSYLQTFYNTQVLSHEVLYHMVLLISKFDIIDYEGHVRSAPITSQLRCYFHTKFGVDPIINTRKIRFLSLSLV